MLPSAPGFDWSATETTYDLATRLKSYSLMLDWYPFARSGFHLTTGMLGNHSTISGTGLPTGAGNYNLDGRKVSGELIGALEADIRFPSTAPYLGIGFGAFDSGFDFEGMADLGLAVGRSHVRLHATAEPQDPQVVSALAAERASIQSTLSRYPFYPVFTWSFTYRF
jgi:hypothetical protein